MKMYLINYSLFFCGLLLLINGEYPDELTEYDIEGIIQKNQSITNSENHDLRLIEGGMLGETLHAIVWKGIYNNKTVAVKIIWNKISYDQEIDILRALNATKDPQIEDHGIPRIYYYGNVIGNYCAYAMTLFEGTLEDLYKHQNKHLSVISILTIFKQAIEILEYFNERNILHNDIKPDNIFLLESKVFISDFDLATSKKRFSLMGYTREFASSNLFAGKDRCPMDDLESLVFSIWYVARVPRDRKNLFSKSKPEGYILYQSYQLGKAKDKMLQKCKHFKDPIVRKTFEEICADEMISQKPIPNYGRIINVLTKAIDELNGNSQPHQFEWLKE